MAARYDTVYFKLTIDPLHVSSLITEAKSVKVASTLAEFKGGDRGNING